MCFVEVRGDPRFMSGKKDIQFGFYHSLYCKRQSIYRLSSGGSDTAARKFCHTCCQYNPAPFDGSPRGSGSPQLLYPVCRLGAWSSLSSRASPRAIIYHSCNLRAAPGYCYYPAYTVQGESLYPLQAFVYYLRG